MKTTIYAVLLSMARDADLLEDEETYNLIAEIVNTAPLFLDIETKKLIPLERVQELEALGKQWGYLECKSAKYDEGGKSVNMWMIYGLRFDVAENPQDTAYRFLAAVNRLEAFVRTGIDSTGADSQPQLVDAAPETLPKPSAESGKAKHCDRQASAQKADSLGKTVGWRVAVKTGRVVLLNVGCMDLSNVHLTVQIAKSGKSSELIFNTATLPAGQKHIWVDHFEQQDFDSVVANLTCDQGSGTLEMDDTNPYLRFSGLYLSKPFFLRRRRHPND